MEQIRSFHNQLKRDLIVSEVSKGDRVLDVGCGYGGDLPKWKTVGVRVDMCDPLSESIEEAKRRVTTLGMKTKTRLFVGDIRVITNKIKYDILCYNFSLQYIFSSRELFFESIEHIDKKLTKGGKLIGYIPDSESLMLSLPFEDRHGNYLHTDEPMEGKFGDTVQVYLTDTPYYQQGERPEPMAYKDHLITELELRGIRLREWSHVDSDEPLSKLYSRFIFVKS